MPNPIFPSHDACPIDSDTQTWIDSRASWILDQFGWERVRFCQTVLPTEEFFPHAFNATEADARVMLDQLCRHLGVESEGIELALVPEGVRTYGVATAGVFDHADGQIRISIESSELLNPLSLAATIARELCEVHLLAQGRETEDDHGPLTDLLTVFLGLGILTANAALQDGTLRLGDMSLWRIRRQGYITMPMYGYALALFSRIRGENSPAWSRHLRPDVRDAFRKSLTYLEQSGLPELRPVRSTSARPTLLRPESDNEDVDPSADDSTLPEPDSTTHACSFCGTTLTDDRSDGVCDECRLSIEANRLEIELSHQQEEARWRIKSSVLKCGCLFFVTLILLLGLCEWLEIFPSD